MNFHGPLSRHSGKINNWLVLGMQLAAPTALQSPCSGGMHRGQGDCKKPCSVSYAPISNVNLNHRHTQCLSPLTKNTWIIPLVSYSLWEHSEASVPATPVLWNYTLEKKKKKGQKIIVSETTISCSLHCKNDLMLHHWNQKTPYWGPNTGGQIPACTWTVITLKYANDSHRKEPQPHSIAKLNISLAV